MATTTFNVRMDEDVKAQVDEVAALIGMSTAAVFNVFARQFIAHRGFPFEVVAPRYHDFESEHEAEALMDELSMEVIADEG